jgi:leucyl aminopeptidase (aminopeptidase T)
MESDLFDLRYLYYFGEYVTGNEIRTARHLLAQPEETIRLMADTFTEGYRRGFEAGGKDITRKKTVNIRYCLGFERMIRMAVDNFERLGLRPTLFRAAVSVLEGKQIERIGYYGAIPNRQYDFDHKEDHAVFWDREMVKRRLEAMEEAYRKRVEAGLAFGGPAVLEVFGETPVIPCYKEEALRLSDIQRQMDTEYVKKAGAIQNRYIPGEQRSYTIIAFPTPEIGPRFEEIFDETIRINTLDSEMYRHIQQIMIDTLDRGAYVCVKGMSGNRTELTIRLQDLRDPAKETKFENCVADVNIPVGEVFTTPQLEGTQGVLHLKKVYLDGLDYKNFILEIKDGVIVRYSCSNFESEMENMKYIRDNFLHNFLFLPMSEFAIGTNTTAFMAGKKYGIAHLFPILVAEKTGPHFAFGDTCYAHAEELPVYNPDGKEIVARDNEISLARQGQKERTYFQCHTDVTIPYDELGEVTVVTQTGEKIPVILKGRFVLEGCQELNKAFE